MALNRDDRTSTCCHNVWIVGGGLSGLATAGALRNIAGVRNVQVLECLSEEELYDEDAGAAAKVGPNGLRALMAIGGEELSQKIIDQGHILKALATVVPAAEGEQPGKVLVRPECTVADTGLPQSLIRWSLLRAALRDLLPRESIHTGICHDICGYEVQKDGTSIALVNEEGEQVGPKKLPLPSLIVAADGVNSPFQSLVRMKSKVLSGPDAPAIRKSNVHDNGRVNVNAVVQKLLDYNAYNLRDQNGAELQPGTALAYTAPDKSVTCFCASAGGGYSSWAISVADQVDESGSLVQHFAQSSPAAKGPIKDFLLSSLRNLRAPECQFAIDLIEATEASRMFIRRSKQLTLVGPTFVSYDSKVVLVGDSAHAMSPSYGQNFNFALEDSVTLALAIRETDRELGDCPQALRTYSDLRVDRCEEMFRRSGERVIKQMRGEPTEDVQGWITSWDLPLR